MHRFCGKVWTDEALDHIRELIATHPAALRAELARRVCEAFDWRMHDGRLKAMSCKVAMLKMHRSGLIALPNPQQGYERRFAKVDKLESEASDPKPLLEIALADLKALRLEVVAKGQPLRLWSEFVFRYHYLG